MKRFLMEGSSNVESVEITAEGRSDSVSIETEQIGQKIEKPLGLDQVRRFNERHIVSGRVLDGYKDGGRFVTANREIITVDRQRDEKLNQLIDQVKQISLQSQSPSQTAFEIAKLVYAQMADENATDIARKKFEDRNSSLYGQEVLLGSISSENGLAGVCRHRALLFQVLAAEAGLSVNMRRGLLESKRAGMINGVHVWNEVEIDGQARVVDLMHPPGGKRFGELDYAAFSSAQAGFPKTSEEGRHRYLDMKGDRVYKEEVKEGAEAVAQKYQEEEMVSPGGESSIVLRGANGEILLNIPTSKDRVSTISQIDGQTELVYQHPSFNAARMGEYLRRVYETGEKTYVVETDPDTQEVVRSYRFKGAHEGAGALDTPDISEVDTPLKARAWLEDFLRSHEERGDKYSEATRESLINTIKNLQGKVAPVWVAPITIDGKPFADAGEGIKHLEAVAKARMRLRNSASKAGNDLGTFGDEAGDFSGEEQKEIIETPGVKEAIKKLTVNDGEFFRKQHTTLSPVILSEPMTVNGVTHPAGYVIAAGSPVDNPDVARLSIKEYLKTPVGGGLGEKEAKRAVQLGEDSLHALGYSAYYDGIRAKTTSIAGVTLGADGFISKAVVDALYNSADPRYAKMNIMDKYAQFFVDHWEDIDFAASCSGEGASHMKRVLYFQWWLQKNPKDSGKIEFLRKYIHLWNMDAEEFTEKSAGVKYLDAIDMLDSGVKLVGWANRLTTAHKNRDTFYAKGVESILQVPAINPEIVVETRDVKDIREKVLGNVLKSYLGSLQGFSHIPFEDSTLKATDRRDAMAHLLVGLLQYMSSSQAIKDKTTTKLWGDREKLIILNHVYDQELLDEEDTTETIRDAKINISLAALQIFSPYLTEGFFAFLKAVYGGITRK